MELKPYSDLSERFCVHNPDFGRQYYEMYRNRLKELTVYLRAELIQKWENKYPIIESAKKLANEMDQCVLIGTIFKNQKLKPSILKQIMNFHNLDYEPVLKDKLLTDTDSVILESNDCRYNLIGEYDFGALVTGVSCAVLGKDAANGCFIVDDCCFIECRPQIPRPQLPRTRQVFVLFASGLNLADSSANLLPFRRFIAWLKNERSQRNNRYFHLVLAGNSLSTSDTREPKITLWSRDKFRDNSLSTAQEFDKLLHELLDVCDDVSLMPGQWDPADVIFPQQPIHKCLLPAATNRSDRLHLIPNPANFEIFETQLLGTSGQNIDDIWKYSNSTSVIEILKNLLKWSHLAPTCPDTLPAYPIDNRDPFVIDNCPHVLFAGNQKEFACERFHGPNNQSVQLLSIPAFDRCFSIVQMSLETLDCELKSFAENL